MRLTFTFSLFFLLLSSAVFAQSAGDYRSNSTNGDWESLSSWEVFNGTDWVAATEIPGSADGVITIKAGDSLRLLQERTIDQVVIEEGGALAIFNLSPPVRTFTLNDGIGDDIVVNGRLWISINALVIGDGSIAVSSSGRMTIRSGGRLGVDAVNEGAVVWETGSNSLQNAQLVNNGTISWVAGNITLTNATIINSGLLSVDAVGSVFLYASAPYGIVNTASGIIQKTQPDTYTNIQQLNNAGIILGVGELDARPNAGNIGKVIPGGEGATGILTINPSSLHNRTPEIRMEIGSTGAVAGINYDKLIISNRIAPHVPISLSNATLTVTGNTDDPVGTEYTILEAVAVTAGDIIPFAAGTSFNTVTIPDNYTITYNTTSVVLTKQSALPLTWGSFTLGESNGSILVNWSTLQETNTSHFVLEYATDGKKFVSAGRVDAAGYTNNPEYYTFSYQPKSGETNFLFRILQVDLDGKSSYSEIRSIRLSTVKEVQVYPNPVHNLLNVNILSNNSRVLVFDATGRVVKNNLFANKGTQQMDMTGLPAGIYHVSVMDKETVIFTGRIVKY